MSRKLNDNSLILSKVTANSSLTSRSQAPKAPLYALRELFDFFTLSAKRFDKIFWSQLKA